MASKFINEFKAFISRGSAIDMAVGIIVGTVMTSVVNSLVTDVITPPIGLLLGGIDFSGWVIKVGAANIGIGLFVNALIAFFITMFAVFMLVRIVNKIRGSAVVTTYDCPHCKMSIQMAATICPYCCSKLKPVKPKPLTKEDESLVEELEDFAKGFTKKITSKIKKVKK